MMLRIMMTRQFALIVLSCALLLPLAASVVPPKDEDLDNYSYDDFLRAFPRQHRLRKSSKEFEQRKQIFDFNLQVIREHNERQQEDGVGHKLGINEFMDWLPEEGPQRGYEKSYHDAWNRNFIDDSILVKDDATPSARDYRKPSAHEVCPCRIFIESKIGNFSEQRIESTPLNLFSLTSIPLIQSFSVGLLVTARQTHL